MTSRQIFAQAFLEELQKEAGIRSNVLSGILGAAALLGVGDWARQGHRGVTNPPKSEIIAEAPKRNSNTPLLLRRPGTPGAPIPFKVNK